VLLRGPLKELHDRKSPIDGSAIVRLATHSADNRTVRLSRSGLARMDAANQAALVLHELIYATTKDATSRPTRQIVAMLFDPAYGEDNLTDRYTLAFTRVFGEACLRKDRSEHQ